MQNYQVPGPQDRVFLWTTDFKALSKIVLVREKPKQERRR